MEERKRLSLEAKLRQMIESSIQAQEREQQRQERTGEGNIIRRRKGERDKRFSSSADKDGTRRDEGTFPGMSPALGT